MKCPRPGCENEATSKGRCWEPYCEGFLDAIDHTDELVSKADERAKRFERENTKLVCLCFGLEEERDQLRRKLEKDGDR